MRIIHYLTDQKRGGIRPVDPRRRGSGIVAEAKLARRLVNNHGIQTGSNRRHALTDLRPQCVNVPNRIGVDSIKQRAGFLNLLFEFTVIGDISKIERIQKSAKLLDGGFPQLLGLTVGVLRETLTQMFHHLRQSRTQYLLNLF